MDRKRNKIDGIFLLLSAIFFVIVSAPFGAMFYDDLRYSGVYCSVAEGAKSYYIDDFFGKKCDFNIAAFTEPLFVFLAAHSLVQAVIWAVYGLVKFFTRKRLR